MTTDGKDQGKAPVGQGEDAVPVNSAAEESVAEKESSMHNALHDKVATPADAKEHTDEKTRQDSNISGHGGHEKSGESSVSKDGKSSKLMGKKSSEKPGSKNSKNITIPKVKSGSAAGGKVGQADKVSPSSASMGEYQPRQISLVVSRIDPWTVMKVSFLLSVALGIAMVLAGLLVWLLLNSMNVFSSVENFINDIDPTGSIASMIDYLRLPRMMAMSTIIAVSNVILMTAFCTVGALIYNLATSLVGGIKLALTDE
ncbi:DUF3566 domain-containing protein [Varibaculum vaginae]|uniref:DUF3566 domain-containing protein n=1 Tax=Varibaculum vaginae TaxID=2364797 RepID=UPI002E1628F9